MNVQNQERWFAPQHQSIAYPTKTERLVLKFMVLAGIYALCLFIFWYFQPAHRGHPVLFWLLTFSFGYKLLHLAYEWYYLVAIKRPEWRPPPSGLRVDMLTTYVPGEPYAMLENTLRAMVAVEYPHTSYLCDEGDDPYLKKLCAELGVVHVYRGPDKSGAKAGNINYALEHVATGDFCVILDPDHVPVPEFLHRTLPYFDDPEVGYVQCIQAYSNFRESIIAKSAAQQTYFFYGPLMMGMHGRGTVQAIGANCTFRRAALDSIGGHAAGLCEDMHTAMQLHARKWKSVYVPESLSWGQTPSSLAAFFKQQLKWSRGAFELLFEAYPRLFRRFNGIQRIHYFLTPLYFLYGLIGLIDIGVPVAALLSFHSPLYVSAPEFFLRLTPIILSMFVIRFYAQRFVYNQHERGFYFWGGILRLSTWWVYLLGFVYAIFRVKVPYIPTPKDNRHGSPWSVHLPNLAVIALTAFALVFGLSRDWTPYSQMMAGFAALVAVFLGITVAVDQWPVVRIVPAVVRRFIRTGINLRHQYVYRLVRTTSAAVLLVAVGAVMASLDMLPVTIPKIRLFAPPIRAGQPVQKSKPMDSAELHRALAHLGSGDTPVSGVAKPCKQICFDSATGQFRWMVEGKSFYLKGVVYNPEESDADIDWPLTRVRLKRDLGQIAAMGANTVVRTGGSVYDFNFFKALENTDLKVLLRLWSSPDIDYLGEPEKAAAQREQLLQLVRRYRGHKALLGFSIGSNTWSELSKFFPPSKLSDVRAAYLKWLQDLAIAVKELAPETPLIVEFASSYELGNCWPEIQKIAPIVDLLGSTAHHPVQWQAFAQTLQQAKVDKPYLALSFGGAGLWDTLVSGANDLHWYPEMSSFQKARTYSAYWKTLEQERGYNLGGAAYCWRDRLEVTATMAGITDFRGRLKPAYFALKEQWTGEAQTYPLHDLWLRAEYLFDHGTNYFRFMAMSANALDPAALELEWYLCDTLQIRQNSFAIDAARRGYIQFRLLRKYHKLFGNGFTPHTDGWETRLPVARAQPFQRVYLHISDGKGHVVTASYPVHAERLVQRITR